MKIGILTFCFAHNYGAVLQANALKNYIESLDSSNKVTMINYVPKKIAHIYSLNPLMQSKSILSIIRNCLQLPKRFKQYFIFENYIKKLTDNNSKITDHNTLAIELEGFDILVCGSDQIWNTKITGDVTDYFFDSLNSKAVRIAYAASFGNNKLTDYQKVVIAKYLPNFKGVSLREEDGLQVVQSFIKNPVSIVVDPVFLQNRDYWDVESEKSLFKTEKNYILFYTLKSNPKLIEQAELLSKQMNVEIYVIHPTCARAKVNGKTLTGIGPCEFLWLIKNATCVCTDSFHATAFSLIFQKKYFHVKNNGKESRVESILERLNCYDSCQDRVGTIDILDFKGLNPNLLNEHVASSKEFLKSCLK